MHKLLKAEITVQKRSLNHFSKHGYLSSGNYQHLFYHFRVPQNDIIRIILPTFFLGRFHSSRNFLPSISLTPPQSKHHLSKHHHSIYFMIIKCLMMWKFLFVIWKSLIRMKHSYLTFPCLVPTTHSIEILIFFKLAT
jgi:hypothetical protein